MTDAGLSELANAGCGEQLASLSLSGESLFLLGATAPSMEDGRLRWWRLRAGLGRGVTDEGIFALAEAGCGRTLTFLTLRGALFFRGQTSWVVWPSLALRRPARGNHQ